MKKFFKRFYCWISDNVSLSLAVVVSVIAFFLIFSTFDTVPATPEDYKPLMVCAHEVQTNPKSVFEQNCKINIENDKIKIVFYNEQCSVTAYYNKRFDIISMHTTDYKHSYLYAIFGSFCFAMFICGISLSVILVFEFFIKEILNITKKEKKINCEI